jgi:predicted metal-binding membrane protein
VVDVGSAEDMSSMVLGLAQLGTATPFHMHPLEFIRMWTTMMAAMMLPMVAPALRRHPGVDHRSGRSGAPMVAFGLGYLAVWALSGVVPLALLIASRHVVHGGTWIDRTGGVVFVLAGFYQFTPWKQRCLRICRPPLTLGPTDDYFNSWVGGGRAGLSNGLCCLGSCWTLMAALLVVGVMNLTWMTAIAFVFVTEKNWRHGVRLATLVGVTVVGLGIAVLVHPYLLDSLAFAHHGSMMSR